MEKRVKTFPLNLLFFLRFESSFSVYDGYTDVITRIKGVKPAAFICSHSCVFSFQTKNKKKNLLASIPSSNGGGSVTN
jgi:hypothetical protein